MNASKYNNMRKFCYVYKIKKHATKFSNSMSFLNDLWNYILR